MTETNYLIHVLMCWMLTSPSLVIANKSEDAPAVVEFNERQLQVIRHLSERNRLLAKVLMITNNTLQILSVPIMAFFILYNSSFVSWDDMMLMVCIIIAMKFISTASEVATYTRYSWWAVDLAASASICWLVVCYAIVSRQFTDLVWLQTGLMSNLYAIVSLFYVWYYREMAILAVNNPPAGLLRRWLIEDRPTREEHAHNQ